MRVLRYLFPLLMGITVTANVEAHDNYEDKVNNFIQDLDERDFDALRQFVNSKRSLDLQDKSSNLTISGDVRAGWHHLNEHHQGHSLRGGRGHNRRLDKDGVPISHSLSDLSVNLRLDYIEDCAWGVAHLSYDAAAGVDHGHECTCKHAHGEKDHKNDHQVPLDGQNVSKNEEQGKGHEKGKHHHDKGCAAHGWHGSGTNGDVFLKKAYVGCNLYAEDMARFDVELGRRNLYNVFDSKIQFRSRFDGILLKYSDNADRLGDWYANLGIFVIDERVNHLGWVTEFGVLNVSDLCLDLKYSFIDWTKNGRNRHGIHNPSGFKYRNSQFTFAYHMVPEFLSVPAKLYGAFLVNHAARKGSETRHCPKRFGWYAGVTFGQVCQAGDWAVDLQYQYVEANAIPDRDVSGIRCGSIGNNGSTNYKGVALEVLYAWTDNLTFNFKVQNSNAIDKHIRGRHSFSSISTEAVYAF